MPQERLFSFGKGYAAFFGLVDQNEFHRNAAYQIVIGHKNDITIVGDDATKYVGNIVLIKPLTIHRIKCDGPVSLVYLSPVSDFALSHLKPLMGNDILSLKGDVLPFNYNFSFENVIDCLNESGRNPPLSILDPRLVIALEYLAKNLSNTSISEAAKLCGLSRSRLRALAREQLGLPLSTWLLWRKLIEANKALSAGANLSEAALAGNFADQAHFTRTMKRMFGVTPTNALKIYA